ncbi:phosphate signaling complex protein PhoU [Bacteroides sp. 519]|uniref:phosphate signaling complex protein PhoU n=1 Tax=Bacteroides sp. 519 TaxID=2302937 RepID=UPI0013D14594|nr:phosphate signaling complex protein PhoU [Bacteroides sp. 519]NDV60695.1 phosphate transport system regulatory protein PhoU [Bacteroides sp. 519]
MVKFIESELVLLRNEIEEMWTLVYNQLDRAGDAVLTFDKELAQQVMVREKRVNALELKIDSDIEDIIALYNPVGIDLRFVLAMLKINTNLERLGDFAEGIVRFVLTSDEPVLDADLLKNLRLGEMLTEVLSMLEITKRALNNESIEEASVVFAKDNVVDEINAAVTPVLTEYIKEHPDSTLLALNLVSVFRKLERAGDHITNIAEEIVFYIDAKVLKHSGKIDEGYPKTK